MKTRIISGIVMALVTVSFLVAGLYVNSLFICAYIMIVSSIAAFELAKNAAGIKLKAAVIGAVVFSALFVFVILGLVPAASDIEPLKVLARNRTTTLEILYCVYFFFCTSLILARHKSFDMAKILTLTCAVPMLSFAFCFMGGIINAKYGVYYILLLIVFANGCDMGAYFTGVTVGKHKLCPEISPKKTVEGAIGGIVTAAVLAAVVMLCCKGFVPLSTSKVIATVLLTVPLCLVGMAGDLFASVIKRSVGIKDYGNLIPGHGGILDRFDSILLISPLLYMFIKLGVM